MLSMAAKICNEEAKASTGDRIYKRGASGPPQGLECIEIEAMAPRRD